MRNLRYIAHIVIEAETPLAVGSGKKGLTVDNSISRDVYGLPYIPGTAIAGVIRHHLEDNCAVGIKKYFQDIFGYKKGEKVDGNGKKLQYDNNGQGSVISFSSAHLIDLDGCVIEGVKDIDLENNYLKHFNKLPIRDHVKINHKGTADTKTHGKFDEELVFKGVRFAFNIEFEACNEEQDGAFWKEIINVFSEPILCFGGKTRNGFGKMKVVNELSKQILFNLEKKNDLENYLKLDNSLNNNIENFDELTIEEKEIEWGHYQLKLTPESFYTFSAGFGDTEVDSIPKTESFFEWDKDNKNPKLVGFNAEEHKFGRILIPATSVKGAISHRLAFHYNKLNNVWAEELNKDEILKHTKQNKAVRTLFGYVDDKEAERGRVILSDIYQEYEKEDEHIFNHVAIDRFTGGGMDSALFSEKAVMTKKEI
ncbi:MAG: RAMP superfamily CRISPR-associated protein, partial [Bacteroidota bacterium]|nr:RAMP superfamily CRISPR-associated protein [Bacteroidota bacterium]